MMLSYANPYGESNSKEAFQTVKECGAEGIIVTLDGNEQMRHLCEMTPLPCVVFGNYGRKLARANIINDDYPATRCTAEKFVQAGYESFYAVSSRPYATENDERTNGFLEGTAACGKDISAKNLIEVKCIPEVEYKYRNNGKASNLFCYRSRCYRLL